MFRMRRQAAIGPAVMSILATIGLVFALATVASHTELIVRIYVVVLGLLGLWLILGVLAAELRSGPDLSIELGLHRRNLDPVTPHQLEELRWQVAFGQYSAFDYFHRLRPVLIDLAARRLVSNALIDVATDADGARTRLGDEFWLATYGATASEDREAPGPSPAALRRLVEALESL